MAIYAVLGPQDDAKLQASIAREFKDNFYKLGPGQFIISTTIPTNRLSDALKLKGGEMGKVMVVRSSNYTGWHNTDLWEWIVSKTSASAGEADG